MKKIIVFLAATAMVCSMASCGGGRALKSEVDTLSYALGTDFGTSLKQLLEQVDGDIDMKVFNAAVADVLADEPIMTREDAFAFLRNYFNVVVPQRALAASQAYLAEIETMEGVKKTESGLLYRINRDGSDKKAVNDTDNVKVCYEGKLKDGTIFDSSYERGDTVSFALNQVIKGWTEGMQLVGKGGQITLWIPADLAYGSTGAGGMIGPNEALEFKVELHDIKSTAEAAPAAPAETPAE